VAGFNGDMVLSTDAQVNAPFGLAADQHGHVLIADSNNHRVRRIDDGAYSLHFTPQTAGEYTVSLSASNGHHTTGYDFTLNIERADPVVDELPVASTLVYGDSLDDASLTGGTVSYQSDAVSGDFAFVDPAQIAPFGTSSHDVLFTPDADEVFNPVQLQVEVTATAREIVPASIVAADKDYDGSSDAVITEYGALPLVDTLDDVVLDTQNAVAAFVDALAGQDKVVTVTGAVLTGDDAHKYVLGDLQTVAAINHRAVTAAGPVIETKVYDGNATAVIASAGALLNTVPGDDVALDASTATAQFVSVDADTGIAVQVAGLALTGADAPNYSFDGVASSTGSIDPAPLTIAVNDAVRSFRGADPALSFVDFGGSLAGNDTVAEVTGGTGSAGDVAYVFATTDVNTAVGVYEDEILIDLASLDGPKADNYSVTIVGGTLEIAGDTVVSSLQDLLDALNNPDITAITLGGDIDGTEAIVIDRPLVLDGDGFTIGFGIEIRSEDVTVRNLGIVIDAPAGDARWAACGDDESAVCLASDVGTDAGLANNATLENLGIDIRGDGPKGAVLVGPGNTGVALTGLDIVVVGPAPSAGVVILRGAQVDVLDGVHIESAPTGIVMEVAVGLTEGANTAIGTLGDVSFGVGVGEIVFVISVGEGAIPYTGDVPRTDAGLPGEEAALSIGGAAPLSAADVFEFFAVEGGAYRYQHFNLSLGTVQYQDTVTWSGAGFVKELVITVNPGSRVYGTEDPAYGFADFTGQLAGGDTMADVTGGVGAADDVAYLLASTGPSSAVGSYVAEISIDPASLDGPKAASYIVTVEPADLSITSRGLTIVGQARSKTYGAADPPLPYEVVEGSLAAGDAFTGVLARENGEFVGTYSILQGTLTAGPNYSIAYTPANFTINTRSLSMSAIAIATKTYDGDVAAEILAPGTLVGVIEDDDVAVTGGVATFLDATAGMAKPVLVTGLSLTGSRANNYTLGDQSAAGTIAPRELVATGITVATRPYDGTVLAPIASFGLLSGQVEDDQVFISSVLANGLYADADAGSGKPVNLGSLSLAGADAMNYTVQFPEVTGTVTPAAITVAADYQTKVEGESDPELTYQIIEGTLYGSDAFTGNLIRQAGDTPGEYVILRGTLSAGPNYAVLYLGSMLRIDAVEPEGEGDPEGSVEGEGEPEGSVEGEGEPEGNVEGEGEPEGSIEGEGDPEGSVEGEGEPEGSVEGEGDPEGSEEGEPEGSVEGEGETEVRHSADLNHDGRINLSELLRVVQIFNVGGYHCPEDPAETEDGYALFYDVSAQECDPHSSDYNPQDWRINLSEILRAVQFFNTGGVYPCETGEDGFCHGIQATR